jgi:hypothetical protein
VPHGVVSKFFVPYHIIIFLKKERWGGQPPCLAWGGLATPTLLLLFFGSFFFLKVFKGK